MMITLLRWLLKAALVFVAVSVLWVGIYRFVPVPFTFTMVGDVLGGRSVTKDWMGLDRMDPDMARAAIAGEDSRFCEHSGFDFDAIASAAYRNARGGRIRGGSTISQQTAKNAFLFQGGGYVRKAFEGVVHRAHRGDVAEAADHGGLPQHRRNRDRNLRRQRRRDPLLPPRRQPP